MCNETRDGGLNILGSYICKRCEEEMIKDDLSEARIGYYRDRMKMMWRGYKPN
jgi:Inhibitor of sigma-G Gin